MGANARMRDLMVEIYGPAIRATLRTGPCWRSRRRSHRRCRARFYRYHFEHGVPVNMARHMAYWRILSPLVGYGRKGSVNE